MSAPACPVIRTATTDTSQLTFHSQQAQAKAGVHTSAAQGIFGLSTASQHAEGLLGNTLGSAGVQTSATQSHDARQDAAHLRARLQRGAGLQTDEHARAVARTAQAGSQYTSASRAALTVRAGSGAVAEQDAAHAPALRKTVPARGMRRPPGIGFRPVRVLLAIRALYGTPLDDAPLLRPRAAALRMQDTGQRAAAAPESISAGTGMSLDTLAEPGGTAGEQHQRGNDRTAARERTKVLDRLASTHHAADEGSAQLRGQASSGACCRLPGVQLTALLSASCAA